MVVSVAEPVPDIAQGARRGKLPGRADWLLARPLADMDGMAGGSPGRARSPDLTARMGAEAAYGALFGTIGLVVLAGLAIHAFSRDSTG
jgi:hypothetical protein